MKSANYLLATLIFCGFACQKNDPLPPQPPTPTIDCNSYVVGNLAGNSYVDPLEGSKYWNLPIWLTDVFYFAKVSRPCRIDSCVSTTKVTMISKIKDTIDLKMKIDGQTGIFEFTILPYDTIEILPTPDYCLRKRWGEVLEISYR